MMEKEGAIVMLDPKPDNYQVIKRTWEDLNDELQYHFSRGKSDKPFYTVNIDQQEMSKEEIIQEAEAKGYKVTEKSFNYLRFD